MLTQALCSVRVPTHGTLRSAAAQVGLPTTLLLAGATLVADGCTMHPAPARARTHRVVLRNKVALA